MLQSTTSAERIRGGRTSGSATGLLTIFASTATGWRRSWDWFAFASSDIAIRPPNRWPSDLGLAFQLTNIIRDVKEDAGMGRVYLPEEDLEQVRDFGLRSCGTASIRSACVRCWRPEADRAREYYRAGDELDSADRRRQPARALGAGDASIGGCWKRLQSASTTSSVGKVSLTVREKVFILGKGFLKRLS